MKGNRTKETEKRRQKKGDISDLKWRTGIGLTSITWLSLSNVGMTLEAAPHLTQSTMSSQHQLATWLNAGNELSALSHVAS